MKVTIDQDGCIGCGSCVNVCPDVFVLDGDGYAIIVEQHRKGDPVSGEVPETLASCASQAASSCPVQVISVG